MAIGSHPSFPLNSYRRQVSMDWPEAIAVAMMGPAMAILGFLGVFDRKDKK